mmetsp:Transcript_18435/g.49575  ORF Transcript_18435/g.49575 Transcript_18435/m.49575 type:complete len:226 (-) Transcript_18435:516-1193(-)
MCRHFCLTVRGDCRSAHAGRGACRRAPARARGPRRECHQSAKSGPSLRACSRLHTPPKIPRLFSCMHTVRPLHLLLRAPAARMVAPATKIPRAPARMAPPTSAVVLLRSNQSRAASRRAGDLDLPPRRPSSSPPSSSMTRERTRSCEKASSPPHSLTRSRKSRSMPSEVLSLSSARPCSIPKSTMKLACSRRSLRCTPRCGWRSRAARALARHWAMAGRGLDVSW